MDTNTAVSGIVWRNSLPSAVLKLVVDECIFLQSLETLDELDNVLSRDKFDRYSSRADRLDAFANLQVRVDLIEVHSDVSLCRDVTDNKFLSLALDGKADFLISGDDDLLSLRTFGACQILNARDFLSFFTHLLQ